MVLLWSIEQNLLTKEQLQASQQQAEVAQQQAEQERNRAEILAQQLRSLGVEPDSLV